MCPSHRPPKLGDILWPSIERDAEAIVLDARGQMVLVLLTEHRHADVAAAVMLQLALGRGLLVIV